MKYSYQYWQNQLLAEMGIDRWALQTAEVIEIGLDELAESLMPFFKIMSFKINHFKNKHIKIMKFKPICPIRLKILPMKIVLSVLNR